MKPIASLTKIVLIFSLTIVGCAQTPTSATYKYSAQQKMRVAHHWDVLANDVAQQIKISLEKTGDLNNRSLYVKAVDDKSFTEFSEGFYDLLLTRLVNYDIKTCVKKDENALAVEYKAQAIYHKSGRFKRPNTGSLALLTAGILVIRDAILYGGTGDKIAAIAGTALAVSATAEATDSNLFDRFFGKEISYSEVIITTSIVDNNKYLFRKTDIYYIDNDNLWEYKKSLQMKKIEVEG